MEETKENIYDQCPIKSGQIGEQRGFSFDVTNDESEGRKRWRLTLWIIYIYVCIGTKKVIRRHFRLGKSLILTKKVGKLMYEKVTPWIPKSFERLLNRAIWIKMIFYKTRHFDITFHNLCKRKGRDL